MKAQTFEARRFRAMQQNWLSEARARFFLLSSEDMLQMRICRGAQNRLGLGTALIAAIVERGCILPQTTSAYPLKTLLTNERRLDEASVGAVLSLKQPWVLVRTYFLEGYSLLSIVAPHLATAHCIFRTEVNMAVRYPKRFDAKLLKRYLKEGRGTGEGASYNPWITIYDLPSEGQSSIVSGWKTEGRDHHLLSTLELYFFYLGSWSRKVIDIREQYPLLSNPKRPPLEETLAIAAERKIRHPQDNETKHPIVLTTDFLLTLEVDGKRMYQARTIKPVKELAKRRVIEKFELERRYWQARGVDWGIVTERDMPPTVVNNIGIVYQSYFLPQFVDHEELTDTAQVLTSMMREEPTISLAGVAKSCDNRLGIKRGSSLQVAYYLIATRQWRIDISRPLDAAKPLHILDVALKSI